MVAAYADPTDRVDGVEADRVGAAYGVVCAVDAKRPLLLMGFRPCPSNGHTIRPRPRLLERLMHQAGLFLAESRPRRSVVVATLKSGSGISM